MKTAKQFLFIGVGTLLILSSCTMEKRVYMSGYHMEWLNSKNNLGKNELTSKNNLKPFLSENKKTSITNDLTEQQTINNNLADEVIMASSEHSIFVPSVTKIEFNKNKSKITENAHNPTSEIKTVGKVDKPKNKNKNARNAYANDEKSQLIALLLCIFIGALGIHRFYLGYIGVGIIQLLTLGGCGIWALIDLIRIITGDLKPKDDDYDEEL